MDHFIPQPLPEFPDDDNVPEAPGGVKRTVLVKLGDVRARPVRWLWPGKVALGKLTLVAGEPGAGKSFVLQDLAARVSRQGSWEARPAGSRQPVVGGNGRCPTDDGPKEPTTGRGHEVLLWNTHEALADAVRPRLDAAGADTSKIVGVQRTPLDGPEHPISPALEIGDFREVDNLDAALDRMDGCRLVVIDTLPLRLAGGGLHRDARRTLKALEDLARRRNVALVAVVELPQAPAGKALGRGLQMLAAVPEVRAVWYIAHDGQQPERRLMLPVKNNLVEDANGLAFRLTAGRVAWESEPVDPHAVRAAPEEHERREAVVFLREALAHGTLSTAELMRQCAEAGFCWHNVRRMRRAAGVAVRRQGFGPGSTCYWGLATGNGTECSEPQPAKHDEEQVANQRHQERAPDAGCADQGAEGRRGQRPTLSDRQRSHTEHHTEHREQTEMENRRENG